MDANNRMMIPPILRGLSYNRNSGCVVLYETFDAAPKKKFPEDTTLSLSIPDGLDEDYTKKTAKLAEHCASAWHEWRLKCGGVTPQFVVVEGLGVFKLQSINRTEKSPPDAFIVPHIAGKIAVVTGGAQGFGEGIVREFVKAGAFVWIADLNEAGAAQLAEELNQDAGVDVAMPVRVNASDEDSVAAMMDAIVVKTGGFDVFVNNAGVLKAGSVKTMDLKDFKFVTDVNYVGYFLCVKHASNVMALQNLAREALRRAESGTKAALSDAGPYFTDIIQINSKSGLEGSNKNGAYAGGKFGGIGLTQSFAMELIDDNIKVNAVCPGNFFEGPLWADPEKGLFVQYLRAGKVPGAKTIAEVQAFYEAKVPMKRGCRADDVVKAMFYIIHQRYETGQAVPVTGGQIMLK